MIRTRLPTALLCCLLAHGAVAYTQEAGPHIEEGCSPPTTLDAFSIRKNAQETLPILLRNAFDEDGLALAGVNLVVQIPHSISPDCPPSSEPVRGIEKLDNGMLRGWIVPNSRSWNSEIHGQIIEFSPDMVIDWSYRAPGAGSQRLYGDYTRRRALDFALDGGALMMILALKPVPDDWQ